MAVTVSFELPDWCVSLLPHHLFWRYHIQEKRIELLSKNLSCPLFEIVPTLLCDLRFASTVVVAEDFLRFKYFVQHLRQGRPDTLSFRLLDQLGQWRPGHLASSRPGPAAPFLTGCFFDTSSILPDQPQAHSNLPRPSTHEREKDSVQDLSRTTDLASLMSELCMRQQQSEAPLFDAMAILKLGEDEPAKRWQTQGFEAEPPLEEEIILLISHLRRAFEKSKNEALIVNNTLVSSAPLDWAFFVRNRFHSYWIEPLLYRRRPRGAVIFASRQAWRYHPDQRAQLSRILEKLPALL